MAKRENCGFTLIELLVVISIISLLVSILLPSITKAKDLAKSIACASNLKQLALATQMYVDDNDESFPNNRHGSYVLWMSLLSPYMGEKWSLVYEGLESTDTVFFCPVADPAKHNIGGTPWYPRNVFISYGINGYLTYDSVYTTWQVFQKISQVRSSSDCALFQDLVAGNVGIFPVFYFWDWDPITRYDYPHLDSRNVAYVDGHVSLYGCPLPSDMPVKPHGTPDPSADEESLRFYLGM